MLCTRFFILLLAKYSIDASFILFGLNTPSSVVLMYSYVTWRVSHIQAEQIYPFIRELQATYFFSMFFSVGKNHYYNSPCLIPTSPLRSGILMMTTTKLVQPVKCCVL